MEDDWGIVNDCQIRHLWRCPNCGTEKYVSPWFYEGSGRTPVCTARWSDAESEVVCDTDMQYVHTEINLG